MKPERSWFYRPTPVLRLIEATPERLDDLDAFASEPETAGITVASEVRRYCREWREANGIQWKGGTR